VVLPHREQLRRGEVGSGRIYGKGRKTRTVTLNQKACKAVMSYLSVRSKASTDPHLFLTKYGKGIGSRSVHNVVARHLNEAGIPDASAHALRHTFATQHVRRGTKLEVVRQALGHASLETTSVYVHLAREEMDRELERHAL